jgi:hypothetical protein
VEIHFEKMRNLISCPRAVFYCSLCSSCCVYVHSSTIQIIIMILIPLNIQLSINHNHNPSISSSSFIHSFCQSQSKSAFSIHQRNQTHLSCQCHVTPPTQPPKKEVHMARGQFINPAKVGQFIKSPYFQSGFSRSFSN